MIFRIFTQMCIIKKTMNRFQLSFAPTLTYLFNNLRKKKNRKTALLCANSHLKCLNSLGSAGSNPELGL